MFLTKIGTKNQLILNVAYLCLGVVLIVVTSSFKLENHYALFEFNGKAQGTTYHILYYANTQKVTQVQIDDALKQIDNSMSIYKSNSLINAFNQSAKGIKIDTHFKNVVQKSLEISKATSGDFDITVYPLVNAWGFGLNKSSEIPSPKKINDILTCVGYHNLILKNERLIKKKSCVKIDVNGIAQGYTVDVLADILEQNYIENYLIELGGELRVKGKKSNGEDFKIGIEGVEDEDFVPILKYINITSGAITTSGNYKKYYESNGKKISHLINPHSGNSISTNLISVTVYAKNAITADGFDNALMVMGLQKALRFVQNKKDIAAYFIYNDSGVIKDTCSFGFPPIKSINK